MAEIQIKLVRSVFGRKKDQIKTVEALGLKRIGHTVTKTRNDAIDGMVKKVSHLVEVTEIKD